MKEKHLLNYRVLGHGHPIVFLHGFLENNSMWENAVSYYSKRNKCILIELYGHGDSLLPETSFTMEQLATEVLETIHHLTSKDYSIIGHSLGGYVGLEILHHPLNNVKHITLLNSHPWGDSNEKKKERTRLAAIIPKNKSLFIQQAIPNLFKAQNKHKVLIQRMIAEAQAMNPKAIIHTIIAMRDRKDRSASIIQHNNKAMVIQGEFDHLIPAAKMKAFCEKHKIPFRLIEKGDHMCWVNEKIYPLYL